MYSRTWGRARERVLPRGPVRQTVRKSGWETGDLD